MTQAAAGGTYVTPTAFEDTCVTLTAPGDTYVTSAAAAALDICVTPVQLEALRLLPLHLEAPR